MTIDPAKFEAQGKPSLEQARTVYDALPHQTCDTLRAELNKRGFEIGRATCARWISNKFLFAGPKKPDGVQRLPGGNINMNEGRVSGIAPAVRQAIKADAAEAAIIGSEMTPAEASAIQRDMDELATLDMPQLKALQEKERIRYNIMMLRQAQRKSDKLVLIPKDSAAFIVAMTDAAESVPTVPAGHLPGDNAKVIEATANPVSDAIAQFKRKTGVAA